METIQQMIRLLDSNSRTSVQLKRGHPRVSGENALEIVHPLTELIGKCYFFIN